MTSNAAHHDEIIVVSPDLRLKEKLGRGQSLEKIFTIEIIEEAEKAVESMQGDLVAKLLIEFQIIETLAKKLKPATECPTELIRISECAFAIKSHAGFCHYPLVSALARALYLFCEMISVGKINDKEIEVVNCIVNGMEVVFAEKITGDGGAIGRAIALEVQEMVLAAAKRWKKS